MIYRVMRVMQTIKFMRFPAKGGLKYSQYTTEVSPITFKLFVRMIFQHGVSTFWD